MLTEAVPHSSEALDEEAILKAESLDKDSGLYSLDATSDDDIPGEENGIPGPEEASLPRQSDAKPEASTEEGYVTPAAMLYRSLRDTSFCLVVPHCMCSSS